MASKVDLTGKVFGKLTVVEFVEMAKNHQAMWRCLCECKHTIVTRGSSLKNGHTTSCGCLTLKVNTPKLENGVRDITGQKFGRLTVVSFEKTKNKQSYWLCSCECGGKTVTARGSLVQESTRSCGCLQVESSKRIGEIGRNHLTTHGKSKTKEYKTWGKVVARCTDPNDTTFSRYGAKGISICSGWRNSFVSFLNDLGICPLDKNSIDRIDNNGNYSCGHCEECMAKGWTANCRWANQTEQVRNRSSTQFLTYNGRTKPVQEWAEEYGMAYGTLFARLRQGWSLERALNQKVRQSKC